MPKASASRQSVWQRTPKFVYGAVVGTVLGTVAVTANYALALNILIGLVVVAAYAFFATHQRRSNAQWAARRFSPVPVLGALVIGVMSVAGVQYLGSSLAWSPKGTIKKSVQNITTGGPVVDANTTSSGITVKPGDILSYNIVISNVAPNASNQYNDMYYTEMTDTLPAGVELVSAPTTRTIKENIGIILPGKSVVKMYQVKVVSTTNGAIIENKACFTADSKVRDNAQKGCDVAIIKVQVPPTVPPPTTPPPTTPPPTTPPPTTPPPTTPPPTTPPPTTPPPTTPPPTTPPPTTPPPTTPPPTTPPPTTPPTTSPTTPPTPPTETPAIALPTQLPNVGPGSIVLVALFAIITGYLFSAAFSFLGKNKNKPSFR